MARWERADRDPWRTRADRLRAGDCWMLADTAIDQPVEVVIREVGRAPDNGAYTVMLTMENGAVVYLPPDSMVDVVAHRRAEPEDIPGRRRPPSSCRSCTMPILKRFLVDGLCRRCRPEPPLARGPIQAVRRLLGLA